MPPAPPAGGAAADHAPALAALFDERVVVAAAIPSLEPGRLYREEVEHVAKAVPARRAEFLTARVLARQALERLGFEPTALAPNPDRSPRWPGGAVGSISHTAGLCAVAVAKAPEIVGLGLDLEPATALDGDLEDMVCTAREQADLERLEPAARGLAAKLIFCAKEAFYKCQHPLAGLELDFTDLAVTLDPGGGRFAVDSLREDVRGLLRSHRLEARFRISGSYLLAGATLYLGPLRRD